MKRNIIRIVSLIIVGGIVAFGVKAADPDTVQKTNNTNGFDETDTFNCSTCQFVYESGTEIENLTGTRVTVTVEVDGKTATVTRDLPTGENNIPSPLLTTSTGVETNENYQKKMDQVVNEMVINGEFNKDSLFTRMMGQGYMELGVCPTIEECIGYARKNIESTADENGVAQDDRMDITYEPYLLTHKNGHRGEDTKTFASDSRPGVNRALHAMGEAVKSGSATKYSDIAKGTSGVGTSDIATLLSSVYKGCGDYCDYDTKYYEPDWEYEPGKPPTAQDEPELKEDKLPTDKKSGGTCGNNFSQTTYTEGKAIDDCGLAHYIVETKTNVSVPTNAGMQTAGKSFGWGTISSSQTTTLKAPEGLRIRSEIDKNDVQQNNILENLAYLKAEMDTAKEALESLKAEWSKCDALKDENTCPSYRSWTCGENEKPTNIGNGMCDNSAQIAQCAESKRSAYESCIKNLTSIAAMETIANNAATTYEKAFSEAFQEMLQLKTRRTELNICWNQVLDAQKQGVTTTNESGKAKVTSSSLTINGVTQNSGDFLAVSKGSGDGSADINNNSFPLNNGSDFYIPSTVANGSEGTLKQTIELPDGSSLDIECKVGINNSFNCGGNCGGGGTTTTKKTRSINLVYRFISLDNPFPNNRKTIGPWVSSEVVNSIIKNNRGVKDYNVYTLTPMYEVILTPATIKEIRGYNKKHAYNDYTLECTNGLYCKSTFLRNESYVYNNINISNSCGMDNDDWYACDTNEAASALKEDLFRYLK